MRTPRPGAIVSQILARRSRARTLGFVLASALIGAAVISFAIAGQPGDAPPAQRPTGEIKAGVPNIPAATTPLTVAEVGAGKEIGGMRVLPPGAIPSYNWQARKTADEGEAGIEGIGAPAAASLSRHNLEPLPGFAMSRMGFNVAVAKDGSRRALQEFYTWTSSNQWPVDIEVTKVAPGTKPDIILFSPETGRATGLYSRGKVAAVLVYGIPGASLQAVLEAHFMIGDSYFHVRAPGLPATTLVSIVNQLIEANQ